MTSWLPVRQKIVILQQYVPLPIHLKRTGKLSPCYEQKILLVSDE